MELKKIKKELKNELEKDYMRAIKELANIHNMSESEEKIHKRFYFDVCQSLALLYMKEKGYTEMPDFGYVFGFRYDEILEEYVLEDRNKDIEPPFDIDDLK